MAAAAPAKLQVNTQETTKPAITVVRAPSPERKAATESAAPLTPEPSPSKKRPELRPQTKTPKNADKDKSKDAKDKDTPSKGPALAPAQNRGPQRAKQWDAKRPSRPEPRKDDKDRRDDRNDRNDRRGDDRRGDDRRGEDRRRPGQNWDRQKKEQRPAFSSEDRALMSDKPLAPVHPLNCTWMFWLSLPQSVAARNDRKIRWESNLKELGSNFNSVEHFWSYVHHVDLPSRLDFNSSYYLFKSGTKPMWEHEENMGGGKWVVQLKAPNQIVDEVWQNVMLAIVGEAFEAAGDAITGAVVNRRRAGDRVAVWLRKSSEELIAELGEKIKAIATDGVSEPDVTYSFSIHNAEPPTPQGE